MTRLRFVTRLNPSKSEAGDLASYGNVTFAPMDALADGLGGLDTSLERPADELADGSYSYFAEGDLLLAKVTPCFENGKKALVSGLPNRIGFATSEVHVIRPDRRKVDPNYLRYLLSSETFRAAGIASMTGAGGLRRISDNAIKDFELPVPDLDTQKAIAAYLDRETASIDQLIAKKERQAKLLTEKLSRVINAATASGQPQRLKHLRTYLTSGSRGWGDSYADSGSMFVRIGNVTGRGIGVDYSDVVYVDVPANSEGTRTAIAEGDLLISITAELGAVAVADGRCSGGFVNQHVALLRLARNKANPRYVAYALRNDRSRQQFVVLGYGGTKQGLSLFDVGELSVMLPTPEEQVQIASRLDDISSKVFSLMDAAKASIEKLKERRAALITAAVTGQLDIHEKLPAVATKPDRTAFRVIVGAEIVHQHQNTRRFGRIKNQKFLYLAEAHAGLTELEGNYLRWAAGPYDAALINETERGMEAAGYFRAQPPDGDSKGVTYIALAKAGQHASDLNTLLGYRALELRRLIDLMHGFDTEAVEAIATLYAVWNDALMDGEQPDDARVIRGVLTEWDPEKEKFRPEQLQHWLDWMKRNRVVPRGQGPRTKPTMTKDLFA